MNQVEQDIFEAIKEVIENLFERKNQSSATWTKDIFSRLTQMAYEKDYWVYSHKNEMDSTINEWLYDLVWYISEEGKGNRIDDIELIVESEWHKSFEEQLYDFYKLVQGRANHRLFIFQAVDPLKEIQSFVKIAEESKLSKIGDRFLFCVWSDDMGIFGASWVEGGALKKYEE